MEGFLMIKTCNNNELVWLENSEGKSLPTPTRIDLKTIDDIRLEMAKVYRDMKLQKTPAADGTRLVYVLAQIGKMIEAHELERRINLLEEKL